MKEKQHNLLLKIILIFVLLQPFLDILSRAAIKGFIPNISTFVKPLFAFLMAAYLLICYHPKRNKWLLYILVFGLFTLIHLFILLMLLTDISVILHEFRFIINIFYMVSLFVSLYTLYYYSNDKEDMLRKIKNTIFYTFLLYFVLYLVAILSNTSGLTYEYSDKYKLGYKGWYDSGQILGHAFSILFPIILYNILKPKNKKILRVLFMALALVCVSLLGTKVPYFITLIVLILYLVIVLFIKVFNKEFVRNWFNVGLVLLSILALLLTYKYTPVCHNTNINKQNLKIDISEYDIGSISGSNQMVSIDELLKKYKGENTRYLEKYYNWSEESSEYLEDLYYAGKIHPSDTRAKQFFYSYKKYMLSDFLYKLFGIGYLNQDSMLAIERDFFMALFNFGIIGFLLFLFVPVKEFIKSMLFILRNLSIVDLETYMLFMGVGIFFCISMYAGYTFIYTNFSIFLALLFVMLKLKIWLLKDGSNKKVKSISFLALHLGYGGIESSIINSANALVKKYDVEIISFYRLKKNQESKIDKRVKVKFLFNGGPNKEEISLALRNKKFIRLFIELVKGFSIVVLKKVLMIIAIRRCKSDAIVSTRVEYNILLNNYGKFSTLKIAQEHRYHNNEKDYIRKISNCYYNIDYLCALTTTLKNDYELFFKKNPHTKVVLLPNMLTVMPHEKSNLNNKNIITVSRLDYGKRNNEIIEAFSKLEDKECKLFIIGDGAEYNNLDNLIKDLELEDRVFLLGYKNQDEIKKYMLESCLFLMASVTEGLPMVLLEAMSYGVPCIAYRTESGVLDIIDDGINGFVIENRDSSKYVEKINLVLSDINLRKKLGKNSSVKAREFYSDNVLKIWEKILRKQL